MKTHKIIKKLKKVDTYRKIESNEYDEVSVFYEALTGDELGLLYSIFANEHNLLLTTEDKYIVVNIYPKTL